MKSGDERWAVKLPNGEWHPHMFEGRADAKSMAGTYENFAAVEATVVRVRVVIEEVESEVRSE